MKKFLNSLISDLKKIIVGYGFIASIIVVFLLCFTSVIYRDILNGKEYTVIEILLSEKNFTNMEFSSQSILYTSVSPYITIFLPILSSIPFVTTLCAERSGGNIRFIITRTGKMVYCISKFLSALLSGMLSVMLGFVLYSVAICISFECNIKVSELIKMYIGMAFYGAVSVLPALLLSAFIKNKYVVCCFPFIFMHFYYTIIAKIQDYLFSENMGSTVVKMGFLFPDMLKNILLDYNNVEKLHEYTVIYYSLLTIFTFIGFVVIMNRRFDYGQ